MQKSTVTASDENKAEVFGPYEVYERIGVGGMASVHRAKKQGIEGFERVVALKRMLSHLADDETFIKSFVREARLASQLQHANIIQIYDLGRVDRVYYIAMEFVRGQDLRKLLKQTAYATGPMPVAMMLTLIQQLCDALDYAHSLSDESGEPLGIVHRDISPSNLLIAADGHLKIIDFGIAKATSSSLRTLSGRVKGKFAYMAPESIQGKRLDNRSDIFSMGIVAHEMLTARPLFAARSQFETIRKISQDQVPPPSRYNPECPPELDEVVMTALAKTPEERWQTAGAMHRALDHVAKRHGLQATNREIAEWIEWAFQQPLQPKRVSRKPRPAEGATGAAPDAAADLPDSGSIEMVWGGEPGRRKRSSGPQRGSPSAPVAIPEPVTQRDEASAPVPAAMPAGAALGQPAAAADRRTPGSKSSKQSTVLGVAPPPGPLWQRARGSDDDASPRPGGAPRSTPGPAVAYPVAKAGGSGEAGSGPMARAGAPARRPIGSALQIALVALLGIGAAAAGYLAVRGFSGSAPAPGQAAGAKSSGSPQPGSTTGQEPGDAAPIQAAAAHALDAHAPPPADAAPPAAESARVLRKPADGSPLLRVPAGRVTQKAGKSPRVRRSQATDDAGIPVVVRAELCIAPGGEVTSVDILDAPEPVHRRVRAALEEWRYEPFVLDGEAIAVCFGISTELRDR